MILYENKQQTLELRITENPASTARDIEKHWTEVITSLGLIGSAYLDLPTGD